MRRARLMLALTAAACLASAPAGVLAHAELVSSSPATDAQLEDPPREVTLTFDGELLPDGSGLVVTLAGGGEVGTGGLDLDVADRNVIAGEVTITEEGLYVVAWTAASVDGHAASGEFSFRYGDAENAPDSALPAPEGPGGLLLAGAALLALALLTAAWTARRRARDG